MNKINDFIGSRFTDDTRNKVQTESTSAEMWPFSWAGNIWLRSFQLCLKQFYSVTTTLHRRAAVLLAMFIYPPDGGILRPDGRKRSRPSEPQTRLVYHIYGSCTNGLGGRSVERSRSQFAHRKWAPLWFWYGSTANWASCLTTATTHCPSGR